MKKTQARLRNAEYQRQFVARQHRAGRVRVQLWITRTEREAVEALLKRLRRTRKR